MKNHDNNISTNKLSIFAASILICCFLYCLTSNPLPLSSFSPQSHHTAYSLSGDTEEPALNVGGLSKPIHSASKFENRSQFANWTEVEQHFFQRLSSDDYLMKEPINIHWFLQVACDRLRVSGWKDSNLLYKFINALI
jgi:hypothetical protein